MNPNDLQMLFQMLGRYGNQPLPDRAGPPSAPSTPSVDALAQYKSIMQMLAAQNPQMMPYLRQIGPGGMPAMANQLKPYTTQPAHGSWADYAPTPAQPFSRTGVPPVYPPRPPSSPYQSTNPNVPWLGYGGGGGGGYTPKVMF